jgi:hypothetical protein
MKSRLPAVGVDVSARGTSCSTPEIEDSLSLVPPVQRQLSIDEEACPKLFLPAERGVGHV